MLLDSHCHLDDSSFDADREAVIERARAAGVRLMMTIASGGAPEDFEAGLRIAESHDSIYAAAGIHPQNAAEAGEGHFQALERLAGRPKFLAIGEIGLDYFHESSPRDVQQRVLIRQLELARAVERPVVIHCRDAWADLREIFAARREFTDVRGILHCFSGSREDALHFLDVGFLVSFAGNLTFKKAEGMRAIARELPLDRLLTETDCPYLAPQPNRGKRNEPAWVRHVTGEIALLHGLTEEETGARLIQNFTQFFKLGD